MKSQKREVYGVYNLNSCYSIKHYWYKKKDNYFIDILYDEHPHYALAQEDVIDGLDSWNSCMWVQV